MFVIYLTLFIAAPYSAFFQGTMAKRRTDKWYGPSFRPAWWNPELYTGRTRGSDFGYTGEKFTLKSPIAAPIKRPTNIPSTIPFFIEEMSFSNGAFEGCMIGLSIGLVMGTLRAISLDGVPHAEDETPCKTLIYHTVGGMIAGALVGLVHAFLTQCLFK